MRTRFAARVADADLRELGGDGFAEGADGGGRGEDAADGGALLAGLDGHFTDDFLDHQVELGTAGGGVGSEDGGIGRCRPRY